MAGKYSWGGKPLAVVCRGRVLEPEGGHPGADHGDGEIVVDVLAEKLRGGSGAGNGQGKQKLGANAHARLHQREETKRRGQGHAEKSACPRYAFFAPDLDLAEAPSRERGRRVSKGQYEQPQLQGGFGAYRAHEREADEVVGGRVRPEALLGPHDEPENPVHEIIVEPAGKAPGDL